MVQIVVFADHLSGNIQYDITVNTFFHSGKTSILFDVALQMAAHHGNHTCYITNKQLQELPVLSNHAPEISNSALTRIQFQYAQLHFLHAVTSDVVRYLSTADQLAGWFNGVHLHPKPHPSLVVVDNYDQYFDSKVRLSQQGVKSHYHTQTFTTGYWTDGST